MNIVIDICKHLAMFFILHQKLYSTNLKKNHPSDLKIFDILLTFTNFDIS